MMALSHLKYATLGFRTKATIIITLIHIHLSQVVMWGIRGHG